MAGQLRKGKGKLGGAEYSVALVTGWRSVLKIVFQVKGLFASKQIPGLFKEDDTLASSWEEMEEVVSSFFKQSLGECAVATKPDQTQALEDVLAVVSDKLTVEEKGSLNAPLSMDELGEAGRNLKKLKCPGPDNIPAKFY